MENACIKKNIDELGRIVLPKEIRKVLGFEIRTAVDLYIDGNSLVIKKPVDSCAICNSSDDLCEFRDKKICKKCMDEIKSN